MFHFWNQFSNNRPDPTDRRPRGPITIGFEQLEEREMLSSGIVLSIIPTESRPLMSMPRPYIGSFNPESERAVTVRYSPEPVNSATTLPRPSRFRSLGSRFRGRGFDRD
jgi:hypothetical protein